MSFFFATAALADSMFIESRFDFPEPIDNEPQNLWIAQPIDPNLNAMTLPIPKIVEADMFREPPILYPKLDMVSEPSMYTIPAPVTPYQNIASLPNIQISYQTPITPRADMFSFPTPLNPYR